MIRAASIGLGWWAGELAEAVQGKSEKISIAACYSRSPEKRKSFSDRFGARAHESFEEVLSDREVDAVLLTTPHSQHAAQVEAAARAGKHVFAEKPFTLTAASGRQAAAACKMAGVVLAVGHNRRFAPAASEIKRMIDAGELGTLLHVETHFSAPSALNWAEGHWRANRTESPAGGLAGLGIHMIDIVAWFGGEVNRTSAFAVHRALKVDIEDSTSALFTLQSGATGYLGTTCAAPFTCWANVYGTKANVFALDDLKELWVQTSGKGREQRALASVNTLKAEFEAFADSCVRGVPFAGISPDEAVHGVAVMQAIAASAERGGQPVEVEKA